MCRKQFAYLYMGLLLMFLSVYVFVYAGALQIKWD